MAGGALPAFPAKVVPAISGPSRLGWVRIARGEFQRHASWPLEIEHDLKPGRVLLIVRRSSQALDLPARPRCSLQAKRAAP